MDEESYDDTDDFDEDESPKPRKTLMNMIRRRTQHQRPSYGSNFIYISPTKYHSYHTYTLYIMYRIPVYDSYAMLHIRCNF